MLAQRPRGQVERAAVADVFPGTVVPPHVDAAGADDLKRLRIISWADYVPADVVADFQKETGIKVEVTLSNNEEMISKLRATGEVLLDGQNILDARYPMNRLRSKVDKDRAMLHTLRGVGYVLRPA